MERKGGGRAPREFGEKLELEKMMERTDWKEREKGTT